MGDRGQHDTHLFRRKLDYLFTLAISHVLFPPKKDALKNDLHNFNGLWIASQERKRDKTVQCGQSTERSDLQKLIALRAKVRKFRPGFETKEFPSVYLIRDVVGCVAYYSQQ